MSAPEGFGAGTTGAGSTTPVLVATYNDLKTEITASGSKVILVSGTITIPAGGAISAVIANKTIIGLPGAKLVNNTQTQSGSGILYLKNGSTNVVIRNIIFEGPGAYDVDGRDNLTADGCTNLWVDHCEFQDGTDGNFDIKGNSDNVTVSWCKFTYLKPPTAGGPGGANDHRFSDLIGSGSSDAPADGHFSITFQNCYWADGCKERMPRARNSELHILNCYYKTSVPSSVALGLGGGANNLSCYVENTHFETIGTVYKNYSSSDGGTVGITFSGCLNGVADDGLVSKPSYNYTVLPVADVAKFIPNTTCGAGATLQVTPDGDISTPCMSTGANDLDKIDVWDFGGAQLDTALFKNQLTASGINAWYDPAITVGSSGNVLPGFSAGLLSWTGGGNDRLRTTNTNLTRYDQNISTAPGYTGRVYVNSGAAVGRFMSLNLNQDDEVTIIAKTDAGGTINFENVADPNAQKDAVAITSDLTALHFVAKTAGAYHIFDTQGKPSYYRIYRKNANYIALTGNVDVSQAVGLPANYELVFTNEAGKSWNTTVSNGTYSLNIPAGYTYQLSLSDANGYIIGAGNSVAVTDTTTVHDVTIRKVDLFTVTGAIIGLDAEISNLDLVYTPDATANPIFFPTPVIDAGGATYTVELEPNLEYTISAEGVNDFYIPANTITIGNANTSADVTFDAKPVFQVSIGTQGLTPAQLTDLGLVFSNLYESDYTYQFSDLTDIALRNGTYTIAQSGLDAYPVTLGLTSNLTIANTGATKLLHFIPVTNWNFDDQDITNGVPFYKGLLFTGQVANEIAKGHLTAKGGATIKVPAQPGETVKITYYYTADFSIDNGPAITTNSQSTSQIEHVEYKYPGSVAGFVTINVGAGAATSYFLNISLVKQLPYKPTITVGADKEYQSINEALDAVRNMIRANDERVTILVDPGNYEEMLLIDVANVSLKNAASNPDIDLLNKGVDIGSGAVRVTAYYGHGYNYFSMGNDQKWHADALSVNKENGYLSFENKGAGTTNGSFWNATVVVAADGFMAEQIIFENSFNQYISQKEADDVVVEWAVGGKGQRPATYGSTAVQDRSFVERAAAMAITNKADKVILNKCRVVGRQDAFFGGSNSRVVVYKGSVMGAVDYIFGGMTAVFYKTELAMNTSDMAADQAYITAAQQSSGRGFLMYTCNVTSALPGIETASIYRAKPGYFGRPWQASTSEVVFYNTNIETTDFPGSEGLSLITPLGWQNTLGGESSMMYEYGTVEVSGVNNSTFRAPWSTLLTQAKLSDGADITTFNFTKGTDGWDPLPALISEDPLRVRNDIPLSEVNINVFKNTVFVSEVRSNTVVKVYNLNGHLSQSFNSDIDFNFNIPGKGVWIICVRAADGQKTVKVMTH